MWTVQQRITGRWGLRSAKERPLQRCPQPDPWNLQMLLYVAKRDEIKDADRFTLRWGQLWTPQGPSVIPVSLEEEGGRVRGTERREMLGC